MGALRQAGTALRVGLEGNRHLARRAQHIALLRRVAQLARKAGPLVLERQELLAAQPRAVVVEGELESDPTLAARMVGPAAVLPDRLPLAVLAVRRQTSMGMQGQRGAMVLLAGEAALITRAQWQVTMAARARLQEVAGEAAQVRVETLPPSRPVPVKLVPQVRFASGPGRKNQCRQNVGIGAANEAI